jgi:hypothetical protein
MATLQGQDSREIRIGPGIGALLVVDDYPTVRRMIRSLLQAKPDRAVLQPESRLG